MSKFLLVALAAFLLLGAPAGAAEFSVNRFDDPIGRTVVCPTICTVRQALTQAAQNSEGDTINVPAGTYTFSTELAVPGDVSIIGAGADVTFIDGRNATRVFHVTSGANVIRGVTVERGFTPDSDPYGGNIVTNHGAGLTLDHVRVAGGSALHGGGIASRGGATLQVNYSLIDNNVARAGGDGGGVLLGSTDNPQTLVMTDSTVAGNRAPHAAGILVTGNNPSDAATLQRVTVADNVATDPGGGLRVDLGSASVQGSIIARNAPSNCVPAGIINGGGNVESGTDCGFVNGRQNTTAGLAATLSMDGGFTPLYTIPFNSFAHDLAGPCVRATDQRDVNRPQGGACDAGAYEAIDAPPPATLGAGGPPFTFSSTEVATTFECSLDGAAFVRCQSPYDPGAGPGAHSLSVRATDRRGNVGSPSTVTFVVPAPTVPPQLTPTPTSPAPTPVVNKVVVVKALKGTVKVRLPGSSAFVVLDAARGIPVGSIVDTRKGTVELTSIPKAGAAPQTARFFDGIFKVTQAKGITTLTLVEALAKCPSARASAAATKPKTRRLWGDGKGAFRTAGKYSAATVRGTKWLVQDSCTGTLTRVAQGVVTVRDHVRHKTIVVRKGKRYVARRKR